MVLLLTLDCASLGAYVGGHLVRHLGVWAEERHRGVVAELEERRMQQLQMQEDNEESILDHLERELEIREASHARRTAGLDAAVLRLRFWYWC